MAKPLGESFSYTEILQLHNDQTFSLTSINASCSFMDYMVQCDTTKGTWRKNGNSVILTTDCKSIDANDNVLQISPIEFHDSIKIKVINFSDKSPVDMSFPYFDDTSGSLILEKRTDKEGVVILPDRTIPFSNHVGGYTYLTLEPGYYYQVTYFDCFPIETFVQDTFQVNKNKLVKNTDNHVIWQRVGK